MERLPKEGRIGKETRGSPNGEPPIVKEFYTSNQIYKKKTCKIKKNE